MSATQVARDLAGHYAGTGNVAAVLIAGSVGRGRADVHSDLELDVYWREPPTDAQRLAPVRALGGQVRQLWPYEPADAEWSEDLRVRGVAATVSGFTYEWMQRSIVEVIDSGDADLGKQMRISAVTEGTALFGTAVIAKWRARTAHYPERLAVAVVSRYLSEEQLGRWPQWWALVQRQDTLMLRVASAQAATAILGTLCALNGVWIEHPSFKWLTYLLPRLEVAPQRFAARFIRALEADSVWSARDLAGLLAETTDLVARALPQVDLTLVRQVQEESGSGIDADGSRG